MQNLFDLTGKKALVTGGSKGIGNRLARGLHDAGAEVVIFYNSTYSEQMAQEMQGDGPAVYAIQCNVADRASLDSAVAQAAEKLGGRIDILINAATGWKTSPWICGMKSLRPTSTEPYTAPSWSDNTCFAKVMAGLSIWPL